MKVPARRGSRGSFRRPTSKASTTSRSARTAKGTQRAAPGDRGRRAELVSLRHVPNHLASVEFPSSVEELGLDDAEIRCRTSARTHSCSIPTPATTHSKVTPNRLDSIRDYVAGGGALLMIGGYMSFQGIDGKARYHLTPVEEALPVRMLPGIDDRVEVPEGFRAVVAEKGQVTIPVLEGIPGELPTMLFSTTGSRRNQRPRCSFAVPATRSSPSGTSGRDGLQPSRPTPRRTVRHREFLDWELFDRFWQQLLRWLTRTPAAPAWSRKEGQRCAARRSGSS